MKKIAVSESVILYDQTQLQIVKWQPVKSGKVFDFSVLLKPISNESYFNFQLEVEKIQSRKKEDSPFSFAELAPHKTFLIEHIEKLDVDNPPSNWQDKIHPSDAGQILTGLFDVKFVETENADDADDFFADSVYRYEFDVYQNCSVTRCSISLREETASESESFTAISANLPDKHSLASSVRQSREEKLFDLAKKLVINFDGYGENVDPPAWHLTAVLKKHFVMQVARLGKLRD